jgi:hypothetical protein
MRAPLLLLAVLVSAACSSSLADPDGGPEPDVAPTVVPGCYALQLGADPSADVTLPSLIELTSEPAPGFVEPGRFTVLEPGATVRKAPISWWRPRGESGLDLVLGGGFTGYTFTLTARGADWVGQGSYCADFGVEPAPGPLPARLTPTSCP